MRKKKYQLEVFNFRCLTPFMTRSRINNSYLEETMLVELLSRPFSRPMAYGASSLGGGSVSPSALGLNIALMLLFRIFCFYGMKRERIKYEMAFSPFLMGA